MMKSLAALTALLCLAACGEPAPEARPGPASSNAAAAPEPIVKSTTVPAAFHGVWAATAADCDKPAETRLEIAADQLRFYESSGPVTSVEAAGPEILVIVSLSGEGALSQRSFRYRLIDGERLFDVRNGLERARCPAA